MMMIPEIKLQEVDEELASDSPDVTRSAVASTAPRIGFRPSHTTAASAIVHP
jgi:hypothetical protein